VDVLTETEALSAANDFANSAELCETQRSRLLRTIRVFFFEKQPPTIERRTLEQMFDCYKKKGSNKRRPRIILSQPST
jgi:hypothetical protein